MAAAVKCVRITHKDGTYRVFASGEDRYRCVEEMGTGEREVEDWKQIPDSIWPFIREAAEMVLPTILIPSINPWENPSFRFGNMDSCSDCDGVFA